MLRVHTMAESYLPEKSANRHRKMARIKRPRNLCMYILAVSSVSLTIAFLRVGISDFERSNQRPILTQEEDHRFVTEKRILANVTKQNTTLEKVVVQQENTAQQSRLLPKNRDLASFVADRRRTEDGQPEVGRESMRNPAERRIHGIHHKVIRNDFIFNSLANYYTPPPASGISRKGIKFNTAVKAELLAPPMYYLDMNTADRERFTFVTWSEYGRFATLKDFISRLQHGYKGHIIVVYDMGLLDSQVLELYTYCSVAVRKVDLAQYPTHVADVSTFAFKPVIFRSALLEFQTIVWLEPELSIPLMKLQWETIRSLTRRNDGWMQIKADPNKQRPDQVELLPALSEYLPNMFETQNSTKFVQSGMILAYNSERVYKTIVHWWYLCALDKLCFESSYSTSGCVRTSGVGQAHVCRHNDQTILDILTTNAYGYDMSIYSVVDAISYIQLKMDKNNKLLLCDN